MVKIDLIADELRERNPLIVIVSNRGPFSFSYDEINKRFTSKRGAGGLVTALLTLAQQNDVLWVAGALGDGDRAWLKAQNDSYQTVDQIALQLVDIEQEAYDKYYSQIANPLLWFVQHNLWDGVREPIIDMGMWDAWRTGYVEVNRIFAEAIAKSVEQIRGDSDRPIIIFPQDYHLYLVPRFLREILDDEVYIQHFLHIPWPSADSWRLLPEEMRFDILTSMLLCNRVGFQTKRDAFNFIQTARFFLNDAHTYGARDAIEYKGRKTYASSYPISIDVEQLEEIVNTGETRLQKAQMINMLGGRQLILRVDRVEPSKNIIRGLQAFRLLLDQHPELLGRVMMVALLVPSRMEVDEYQNYLRDIMAEAGLINASFSDEYWEPVRIIVGNNYARALAAMQIYDALLVNPIADGMNLVAKEGSLVNDRDGVLVLSEHAGAFYELGEQALIVSPYDIYSTMDAMYQALTMSREKRHRRAEKLRDIVRHSGVREWFYAQVADALSTLPSHASSDSTPDTPDTSTSDDSSTADGVSSSSAAITPTASA